MRSPGSPANRPVRRSNHVCRVHTGTELLGEAAAFLQAGRARGDRVVFFASGTVPSLHRQLAGVDGLRELLDAGELRVGSVDEHYGTDEVIDPAATVAAYAAATQVALDDGYRGLCVVAEATSLVRTPEQREAFARYEHLIDRYMADHPFTAMCAYDGRELGDAVAGIACLHPRADGGTAPFQWYAKGGDDLAVSGEVDVVGHRTLADIAALTLPLHGPTVVVDATELGFIDHRGLLTLDEQARRADTTISLVTDTPLVHRLAAHLQLTAVEVTTSCA